MYFIAKCAFCLAIVLIMLPKDDADRAARELTKTVAQDKALQAAVDRTRTAVEHVANEAPKYCVRNHDECLETAKQLVKGATGR